MSFNQTRDLLDVAREFHARMAGLYRDMLKRGSTEGAIQLINTLIEHEEILEQRMTEYEEEVSTNILDTYFKYIVEKFMQCFDSYTLPATMNSMDVIETTRYFDQKLADFYKEMAQKALADHVREVLLNLTQMELREQMTLSRRTLEIVASY